MERHFAVASPEAAPSPLDPLIEESIEALTEQCRLAPADLKPLYLSAIHNLRGLAATSPSQQHLQTALKAIHEITGMKMDQQLMLQFGMARFKNRLDKQEPKAPLERFTGVIEVDAEEVAP